MSAEHFVKLRQYMVMEIAAETIARLAENCPTF